MKCNRCNNELLDGVKYCPFCGEQVHKPIDRTKSNNSFFFLALVLHCCISSIIAVEVSDLLHNINYRLEFTIGLLFLLYLLFVGIDLGVSSYSWDTKIMLVVFSILLPIVYILFRSSDINIKVFLLWLLGCVVSAILSISIVRGYLDGVSISVICLWIGIVLGTVPAILGAIKGRIGLAIGGFFACVASASLFGVLFAVPICSLFLYLIFDNVKKKKS